MKKIEKDPGMEEHLRGRRLSPVDLIVAAVLGVVSLAVYFLSMANYVFPGESAHLAAVWQGLDSTTFSMYPLARAFASLFGGGNASAPVAGAIAVVALFIVTLAFLRSRFGTDMDDGIVCSWSRVGAVVASVAFMLAPAVLSAATHLEPRMFDLAWALVALAVLLPAARASRAYAWLIHIFVGAMCGAGLADSPLFLFMLPLHVAATWYVARFRGSRGYGAAALHLLGFAVAFAFVASLVGDFSAWTGFQKGLARLALSKGWLLVAVFVTLPFVVSLFSCGRAFNEEGSSAQWIFHIAMTLVAVIVVATPLSPSILMVGSGSLPVAACALAAFTAGYVSAYWWGQSRTAGPRNESLQPEATGLGAGRVIAYAAGGAFATVFVVTSLLNLFRFDGKSGAFADRIADRIVSDLGDRKWFVTSGLLDDHVRFAAKRAGKDVGLLCLHRDDDKQYVSRLKDLVREGKLGGARGGDLEISLSISVPTFVQDWIASDPESAKSMAMFSTPDLFVSADAKPVPELLFYGCDPGRGADWSAWEELSDLLPAPKGWGSFDIWETTDPVKRLRLDLRRHLGRLANDRGVWLQSQGRDDEAFALYALVLDEIDADNVSALCNAFDLALAGNRKAAGRKGELSRMLKAINEDSRRRYVPTAIPIYYGEIRGAAFRKMVATRLERAGFRERAAAQLVRAIDAQEGEKSADLANSLARLYANANEFGKSREMYDSVLSKDPENHAALMGLVGLSLREGDTAAAEALLEKARKVAGDDPVGAMDEVRLHILRGETDVVIDKLQKITDRDSSNMEAWSLLAMAKIEKMRKTESKSERAKIARALEDVILTAMKKAAPSQTDYNLLRTRAIILQCKGPEFMREARDAFAYASNYYPNDQFFSDNVIELSLMLDDTKAAEHHAREMLIRDRKAPFANYVMGFIALQAGRDGEAELFLRRAVDCPNPTVEALNDLAEALRRRHSYDDAEKFARKAVEVGPHLYVAWETLAAVLMDAGKDLDEAEKCVLKACELSKGPGGQEVDVRMLVSLARVQIARKDMKSAKVTLRKVQKRIGELSEFERGEFEELRKSAN